MKNAIVTGYSSGIGQAICDELIKNNYNIIQIKSRLEDIKQVEVEVKSLLKEYEIDLLVNCAELEFFNHMKR